MKIRIPERTVFAPSKSATGVGVEPTRLGTGARKLGRTISDIGAEIVQRQRKARHQIALQRVRESAARAQSEFLRRYDPTQYEQMNKDLQDFQRQQSKELLDSAPREIRTQAQGVLEGVWFQGAQTADQLRYEYGSADIRGEHAEYRFEAMARASATEDATEVSSIQEEYASTVDGLVQQGVYGAERAAELKLSFSEGVWVNRLREQMVEDPHAVTEMLEDPEEFPFISGNQRENILRAATSMSLAKDRREEVERRQAEAQEAQARKNSQDLVFMSLYRRSITGELSHVQIDANRQAGLLRPSQYTQLVKLMESGDAQDNSLVVQQLKRFVMSGEITSPVEVLNFVGEGLSVDTAHEIIGMIEQGASVTQSRDFREARDYLDRQLGVTPGINIGALNDDDQQRVARARREMYERVIAGEDPWNVADEMLTRYQRLPQGLPDPMYPDIETTQEAWQKGEINETVMQQQIRLHQQIGQRENAYAPD